jgi:hypothetical protein
MACTSWNSAIGFAELPALQRIVQRLVEHPLGGPVQTAAM